MNKNTDPVIVIIATSNARTSLLLDRALKSVYEQENVNPHQIYIVDDNLIPENKINSNEYGKIRSGIKNLRKNVLKTKFEKYKKEYNLNFDNFFHTTLLKNTRTKGFSGTGAWNTGAFKALQYSDRHYYLAILDDDDEWDKSYLHAHLESVKNVEEAWICNKLKTVRSVAAVSGILRIEKDKTIEIQPDEHSFTKENFFIQNPGLQGSNIFIDLKTFWAIGGFDEALRSATDRDLAMRLLEYVSLRPSKEIKFIDKILVKHYADNDQRVTSNPQHKKEGLDTFYRKYLHQFSAEVQQKSLDRAGALFDYRLPPSLPPLKCECQEVQEQTGEKFNLIIGTISNNANNLIELFKSFYELHLKYGDSLLAYKFFVLENTDNEFSIRPIIQYFKTEKQLNIELIKNSIPNQSIAENRTALQKALYNKGKEIFNGSFVTWVIDDDNLFKYYSSESELRQPNYFAIISKQISNNVDALFGLVSDAPPLPFLSTLRTQLIDFYYNLSFFEHCNPVANYTLSELQKNEKIFEEFYYDLSSQDFQHLEYPYYWKSENVTFAEAFKNFLNETSLLAKGVNVFRKLHYADWGEIVKESIYRGGNTIIFNPELLRVPNYSPSKDYNRRSDFNWAIINKYVYGKTLMEIVLPLKHDRRLQITSLTSNEEKIKADIQGLIFYRVLRNLLSKKDWQKQSDFESDNAYFEKIKKEVLKKIKINNYRIQFLIHQILNILSNKKLWWYDNQFRKDLNYLIQQNIFALEILKFELGKRKFQAYLKSIENDLKLDEKFLQNIQNDIKQLKTDLSI